MAKKKKEKKGGKRMKKRELAELIIGSFRNKPDAAVSAKQLYQKLKLTTHPLKMLAVSASVIGYEYNREGRAMTCESW